MIEKRMMVTDITHTIYYGNVKDMGNKTYQQIGKREDVTDEAIRAVFEWFMKNFQDNEPNEVFEVRYKDIPYVLSMTKESEVQK